MRTRLSRSAPSGTTAGEQSGGKFISSGPAKRAKDAALQVLGSGSALRFNPLRNLQYLRHSASSHFAKDNARLPICCFRGVERRVRRCWMNSRLRALVRPEDFNLTIPTRPFVQLDRYSQPDSLKNGKAVDPALACSEDMPFLIGKRLAGLTNGKCAMPMRQRPASPTRVVATCLIRTA